MEENQIKNFVQEWMQSFGEKEFVKDENGKFMYTAKHHTINLEHYFEKLISDFIIELTA